VAAQELPANLAAEKTGSLRERIKSGGSASLLLFPRKAAWPGAMVKELVRLCAQHELELLIFVQAQSLLAVRALKSATGLPVLWDCRGSPSERDDIPCGPPGKVRNALLRWAHGPAIRLADHLICVSERHAEEMASRYGYARGRITVVPNGVDVGRFRPDAAARAAIRQRLGIAPEDFVAVYCGGMHAWQCFPESVDFANLVASLRARVHLLVLTPELELAQCHLGRAAPGLRHHVVSVAHEEVPRYLAAGDAGLLLRAPNACNIVASPMKFAEYLACGLPVVIGPQVGDYSELVRRRQLGVVVDPAARESWPAAARELVTLIGAGPEGASTRCREAAVSLLNSKVQGARFGEAIDKARRAQHREKSRSPSG